MAKPSRDGDQARLIYQTAECLHAMGRYHEALAVTMNGVELFPDYTDLYFLMGTLFIELGQVEQAEAAFLSCLERGEAPPKYRSHKGAGSFLAHYNLGQIYEMRGVPERASLHYCEAAREGYSIGELRAGLMGKSCPSPPRGLVD